MKTRIFKVLLVGSLYILSFPKASKASTFDCHEVSITMDFCTYDPYLDALNGPCASHIIVDSWTPKCLFQSKECDEGSSQTIEITEGPFPEMDCLPETVPGSGYCCETFSSTYCVKYQTFDCEDGMVSGRCWLVGENLGEMGWYEEDYQDCIRLTVGDERRAGSGTSARRCQGGEE